MMAFVVASLVLVLGLAVYALSYLLFPLRHVRGIPTIPFWVALLPLFKDVDQQDIFQRYIDGPLRKHGAVKLFFAAQWNVLVHRPTYMAEVFKHENVYRKSGNHEKIPHSVLAGFLGDNIISSHGETWKRYQQIIKPGVQAAPDLGVLLVNARKLCNILRKSQSDIPNGGIGIQASLQRCTIANFSETMFRVNFQTLDTSDAYLHQIQYRIKGEIFRPTFMNFPFLDSLGFPSRKRARQLASHFTDQLISALQSATPPGKLANGLGSHDLPKSLLDARQSGYLTEKQFRDNVTILFVAGQENPQLAMISMLYLLAKHPTFQDDLLEESDSYSVDGLSQEALQSMPLLSAVIYESLRLFPPIGQLINRRVTQHVRLGGDILIPEGTYVGYNCYSTNRDPETWGPDADSFRPTRWGVTCQEIQKEYRRRRARAEFISFHGGQRACLGERFAVLQLKVTLLVLVRELKWKLDPSWPDRMTPAGPLCPRNLHLVFTERTKRVR